MMNSLYNIIKRPRTLVFIGAVLTVILIATVGTAQRIQLNRAKSQTSPNIKTSVDHQTSTLNHSQPNINLTVDGQPVPVGGNQTTILPNHTTVNSATTPDKQVQINVSSSDNNQTSVTTSVFQGSAGNSNTVTNSFTSINSNSFSGLSGGSSTTVMRNGQIQQIVNGQPIP